MAKISTERHVVARIARLNAIQSKLQILYDLQDAIMKELRTYGKPGKIYEVAGQFYLYRDNFADADTVFKASRFARYSIVPVEKTSAGWKQIRKKKK